MILHFLLGTLKKMAFSFAKMIIGQGMENHVKTVLR